MADAVLLYENVRRIEIAMIDAGIVKTPNDLSKPLDVDQLLPLLGLN